MRNNFIKKDKIRRKLFNKYEQKIRIYKFLRINLYNKLKKLEKENLINIKKANEKQKELLIIVDKLNPKYIKIEKEKEKQKEITMKLKQNLFKNIYYYNHLVINIPKNASITRIKNRCVITGRARSIYSDFKISRMQMKHLGGFAYLTGVKRASW